VHWSLTAPPPRGISFVGAFPLCPGLELPSPRADPPFFESRSVICRPTRTVGRSPSPLGWPHSFSCLFSWPLPLWLLIQSPAVGASPSASRPSVAPCRLCLYSSFIFSLTARGIGVAVDVSGFGFGFERLMVCLALLCLFRTPGRFSFATTSLLPRALGVSCRSRAFFPAGFWVFLFRPPCLSSVFLWVTLGSALGSLLPGVATALCPLFVLALSSRCLYCFEACCLPFFLVYKRFSCLRGAGGSAFFLPRGVVCARSAIPHPCLVHCDGL